MAIPAQSCCRVHAIHLPESVWEDGINAIRKFESQSPIRRKNKSLEYINCTYWFFNVNQAQFGAND